ncbi:hypothetical protein ACFLQL_03720, partial [Verrucomicrobiota bacterium]
MKIKSLLTWLCVVASGISMSAYAESSAPGNPLTVDSFIEQAKLTAMDGAAGDNLGIAVAFNNDGNTAIVGAYGANVGGDSDQGAAYVFTRSGTTWTEEKKIIVADGAVYDDFGRSVSLSSNGNTAIIGADGVNVDTNNNQGAAYVFTRSGTAWTQQAKLTATDGIANDHFGASVALSSDGNTAIASSYGANVEGDTARGAVYVFTRSGTAWTQQTKLIAADGAAYDYFGRSVALNSDGNTAIAGAYQADVGGDSDRGAAYVFARSGTTWTEQEKLFASAGTADDQFGRSVALNSDGNTAIVGAYTANVAGNINEGAACVFTRSGNVWTEQANLLATDGAASNCFGVAVALSSDGDTATIGAYLADVGGESDQGAAYVFTRSGTAWTQQVKMTAADGAAVDRFGYSVALSGDGYTTGAGAYQADVSGDSDRGAAYVFAVPPPPTGVSASFDFYIDRVRVSWNPANTATGYEVWRATTDDSAQAASIGTGITVTNYDDTAATAGTSYYYWTKTINANGTSVFSTASATGRMLFGPDVRVNGEAGPVTLG